MKHKRSIIKWLAALCLAAAGLSLAACGDELVAVKYTDGKFVNARAGLSLLPAPVSYEPTHVGEAYAFYKKGNVTMYRIADNDPALWLTQEYAGEMTTVFYSDTITLPTLADFGADTIRICEPSDVVMEVVRIGDAATVQAVTDLFLTAEEAELPSGDPTRTFDFKFSSPDWPQIYINLNYFEYGEDAYLYNRNTRRSVALGDLLDGVLRDPG